MLRTLLRTTRLAVATVPKIEASCVRQMSEVKNPGLVMPKHGRGETEEEFDARYEAYFNNPNIDGWEIRKGINDMQGLDLIPEPKIIIACLKACRRVNDYALATRYLEAIKYKCGKRVKEVYPYILQEIKPTLDELGISTPEELGYDKPELALVNPFDIH
ncbi:cytochrome c oxidase subunit 5A-like protein [Dinothrombium tinctorium]|uniref:Cytochrome c oxidase subunit 5A, mitochondrial n=1 Tax=Dinothrombium tinctorium TaxID=1965070 RepID=A0A3S3SRF2_9ACAR|nr:cytochrome c oxidase subunit 5A-like protein [Dinothrombium tinctorium]